MKTQNEIKGEFEKLEEIADRIKLTNAHYCENGNWYLCQKDEDAYTEKFLDGAWYAFQEQQKKIDKIVSLVWSETPDYDLDNKIKEILK